MNELPSQVPAGAEEFVAEATTEPEYDGFVDPEVEAHHQAVKKEIGHLKHESRIESRKLWELTRPLEEQIRRNEKLELDFGDRIHNRNGDKGTEEYFKENISNLQRQNRELRAEIDRLNVDPAYREKRSAEEEMRAQNRLAETGDAGQLDL